MKAGGRLRIVVTLLSVLAATVVAGVLVYQTTYSTLRASYQGFLDKSVEQGSFVLESFLETQFTLLSLYASAPSVHEGRLSDLPPWLAHPLGVGVTPKLLTIIAADGRSLDSAGNRLVLADRQYFQLARAGHRNVSGPLMSRVDGRKTIVVAYPIPGGHPEAAVLTASIDSRVFATMLASIQGLSGAELVLSEPAGEVVASTGGFQAPPARDASDTLLSSRNLSLVPWSLEARIRVDDLMQPVQRVLIVVGLMVVGGGGLIVTFVLLEIRRRRERDQAKEDRTTALKDAYDQIRQLAYHDIVTRLPNRNLAYRRIGEALQGRLPLRVFVVALARFRSLTTTFGMRFGDDLLREAGERLVGYAGTGEAAFVGRLGGSEFLVLKAEAECGPGSGQEILDLFEAPLGTRELKLQIRVHVGSCRLDDAGGNAEEVVRSAETALWAAREKGPHEASELTSGSIQKRLRRAQVQKLLHEALARGELEVHYQPQVSLKTGATVGYEALLRWTNPELGRVAPDEFIPVAEETGAIIRLGAWVLDEGIRFARALEAAGTPAVVSVNVSAVQLLQLGFLDGVAQRVKDSGLDPRWLGLEITESTLIENIGLVRTALERLMETGVKVSLDDFGTGYSSLHYLKDLPLHVLKIDKSFADTLGSDDRTPQLIRCIVDLAHHLGLVVVAEGAENADQNQRLSEVGCDVAQGYFTGRPQSAHSFLGQEPL